MLRQTAKTDPFFEIPIATWIVFGCRSKICSRNFFFEKFFFSRSISGSPNPCIYKFFAQSHNLRLDLNFTDVQSNPAKRVALSAFRRETLLGYGVRLRHLPLGAAGEGPRRAHGAVRATRCDRQQEHHGHVKHATLSNQQIKEWLTCITDEN